MKRNDATFNAMIARLQSGEITRNQASVEYEVNLATLNVWITRSNLSSTMPSLQGKCGAAAEWASIDHDKVGAAVQRILSGEISALAMSKLDPTLSASTLAKKARQARLAQGIPAQHRAPPVKADHLFKSKLSTEESNQVATAIAKSVGMLSRGGVSKKKVWEKEVGALLSYVIFCARVRQAEENLAKEAQSAASEETIRMLEDAIKAPA